MSGRPIPNIMPEPSVAHQKAAVKETAGSCEPGRCPPRAGFKPSHRPDERRTGCSLLPRIGGLSSLAPACHCEKVASLFWFKENRKPLTIWSLQMSRSCCAKSFSFGGLPCLAGHTSRCTSGEASPINLIDWCWHPAELNRPTERATLSEYALISLASDRHNRPALHGVFRTSVQRHGVLIP